MSSLLKFWFFGPPNHSPRKARWGTRLSPFLPPVYCVTLTLNAVLPLLQSVLVQIIMIGLRTLIVNLHGLPIRIACIRSIIPSSANDLTLVSANVNSKFILFSQTLQRAIFRSLICPENAQNRSRCPVSCMFDLEIV